MTDMCCREHKKPLWPVENNSKNGLPFVLDIFRRSDYVLPHGYWGCLHRAHRKGKGSTGRGYFALRVGYLMPLNELDMQYNG